MNKLKINFEFKDNKIKELNSEKDKLTEQLKEA